MIIDTSAVLAILFDEVYALAKTANRPLLYKGDDFS
jgi:uncharacterized protein with PIN domain